MSEQAGQEVKTGDLMDEESNACIFCIESLDDGELAFLPCFHKFHKTCLAEWKANSHLCPVCRHPMDQSGYEVSLVASYTEWEVSHGDDLGQEKEEQELNDIIAASMQEQKEPVIDLTQDDHAEDEEVVML